MNEIDRQHIISQDYADVLVEYDIPLNQYGSYENQTTNYIDNKYATVYFLLSEGEPALFREVPSAVVPKVYGLIDTSSMDEIGVTRVQNIPYLSLYGKGVLLGFVDTGIDYTNPIFKNADNTTRIVSIWDQTMESMQASEDIFYYGTQYSMEQINLALQNDNPFSVVPSTDEIGHGTMLAGLAGGSRSEENSFVGVAPQAEFIVVKLKNAKENVKNYYGIPLDAFCYSEIDIMFGIQYLYNMARKLGRPIAICFGLGTTQGNHTGFGIMNDMITKMSTLSGIAFVIGAGNEGNLSHHYYGEIDKTKGFDTVELKIGEQDKSFAMELWGNVPGTYSIDITSPSGEYIPRIPARINESRVLNFLFEATTLEVKYNINETLSGDQLITFVFRNAAPGIWKINVYAGQISSGFHIWLPMRNFISADTLFLKPNPYTTITNPGNTIYSITVTAYNHFNESIFMEAGRGYTQTNYVKPEFAAPGVEVFSPQLGNQYDKASGTSIAAALTIGIAAMLLEWGIVRGNDRAMNTIRMKKYLIRGVKRKPELVYPNREWGYGILDIYGSFLNLGGESNL